MAALTVIRHVAYAKYLRDGRTSIDLAPTLVWEACLTFTGILTASVPVLLQRLAKLGSVHLLSTNHVRTGRGSSYQLSTLESGTAGKPKVGLVEESAGENSGEECGDGASHDDRSVSFVTSFQPGRRHSQGSQVQILGQY
jgi:hypothetical protein